MSAADFDVCIVGLKCFGLMSKAKSPRYIGGIETDLVTLARALAAGGKRVALIVYDEGQPEETTIDGVTVFRSFPHDAGLPGLRFLFPRATGLIRSIRHANAAVVVQMGAGVETGWSALAVKLFGGGGRFLFLVGGDRDCLASLPGIRHLRERIVYRLGLRMADGIVAQTDEQAQMLETDFGLSSEILRLPNALADEMPDDQPVASADGAQTRILWVGRIDRNKRPHWLLDLAAAYPEYQFDIVGEANVAGDYSADFADKAGDFANISVHGKVARHEIARFYKAADLLCCTSEFEGFPATFLEAWSFGLPVVSTVDPGGNIEASGAGCVVPDLDDMRDAIKPEGLEAQGSAWSKNARELYERKFSPDACLARFSDVLRKVA